MLPDAKYIVIEPIKLQVGGEIRKGTEIRRTHGTYYMDGMLLPKAYQEDFDRLTRNEEKYGWYHLEKRVDKVAFRNSKEDL